MTAQNMGKKILTDAGYEVVAVSNGAAAVKKIAEQKPDIIILDVYMPGYNGLEVCEKVRASMDTLKTPVLLTVGKMEPYRPEDANRVRADGVIIKPFEATDLLAIVKKLEEKITPKTVALAEQTVLLERPPEFTQPPREEMEVHSHLPEPAQGVVDVPDHMATAAAFSDLLGMDASHSLDPIPPPRPIPEPEFKAPEPEPELKAAASDSEKSATSAPASEFSFMPVGWNPPVEPPPIAGKPVPQEEEEAIKIAPPGYAIDDTQPIPVYKEPETEAQPVELKAVAVEEKHVAIEPAMPSFHIEVEEPEKNLTPEPLPSAPAKPVFFEPELDTKSEFSESAAKTATESEPPVVEVPGIELEPVKAQANNGLELKESEKPAATPEDEFEARVAAAMSIYDEPAEEKVQPEPAVAAEKKPDSSEIDVTPVPVPATLLPKTPFSFEYSPPVAAPEFHPVAEARIEAQVEPECHAIAPSLVPKPEIEPMDRVAPPPGVPSTRAGFARDGIETPSAVSSVFEKPPVFAESSFVHNEFSYKAIEIPEKEPVAQKPALEPEIQPENPPVFLATPFVHEEVSSAAVEKIAELPASALKPVPEPEVELKKSDVLESRPPVQEEISSATIEKIAAGIEAELPAAAAAGDEIGGNTQLISSVVHRVMERLKPELIAEITRELKSKK